MNRAIAIAAGACSLILASCASQPFISGGNTLQHKVVSLPKEGQQVHVVIGGLVHLKVDYRSGYTYKLVLPLSMGFFLGKVIVSNEEGLFQGTLDGEEAFCTRTSAYHDPLAGPHRIACFQSAEKGKFNNVKVAPGMVWFNKELVPPIEYTVGAEVVISSGGKPLKRELIFDGGDKENLLFTEKIYEKSVETASRLKPLIAKVGSIPSKVTLDGAVINIINYTRNSLTYSIEKPWD